MIDFLKCLVPETWPDVLPGYEFKPAFHSIEAPALISPPPGIIVHSGDSGPGTAEWAWNKLARFYAHFAWSNGLGRYVQTCGMRRRAPHAGPYNGWLGCEMPGPWRLNPRPSEQRQALVDLVWAIVQSCPSVTRITGHEFIDRKKRDPGPGVSAEWFAGLGLEVTWEWVGRGLLG